MDRYYQSELAFASYAVLTQGAPDILALQSEGVGMTAAQARSFSNRWRVVEQYNDTSNGLSATVFQDARTGNRYLAVRGTEPNDPNDLWTDLIDIGLLGTPERQAQYASLRDQVQVWLSDGTLVEGFTVAGHSLGGFLAGALLVDFPTQIDHAYLYNAPGIGGAIVGGAIAGVRSLVGREDGATLNLSKVSNLIAQAGPSFAAGLGVDWGMPIPIVIEDQSPNLFGNHSIVHLTDALAVQALVGSLSATADERLLGELFKVASNKSEMALEFIVNAIGDLFQAGSPLTGTEAEPRDALYIRIQSIEASTAYQAAKKAAETSHITSLAGLSAGQIVEYAESSIAYRYALRHLNSFAITGSDELYTPHNLRGELDRESFTEEYLKDRAAFLERIIYFNMVDKEGSQPPFYQGSQNAYTGSLGNPYAGEALYYQDISTNIVINQTALSDSRYGQRRIISFAGDAGAQLSGFDNGDRLYGGGGNDILNGEAGHDYLEGGSGNDRLYGGKGNDTLLGMVGNDYLDGDSGNDYMLGGAGDDTLVGGSGNDSMAGGSGHDTYIIDGSAGHDIIDDPFGGVIKYKDHVLSGGTAVSGGAQQWRDGHVAYSLVNESGTQNLLITVGANTVTVLDWQPGKFGIQLTGLEEDTPINADRVIEGDRKSIDFDLQAEGVQTETDDLGNIKTDPEQLDQDRPDTLYDSIGNDELYGHGGNDVLNAHRGGNDLLDGGGGDDWLRAGAGDDTVVGGAGSDRLHGQTGDDHLYADEQIADVQVDLANTLNNGIAERGSLVDGGAGTDFLVGARAQDLLLGGSGRDILHGGAGDDVLYGDSHVSLVGQGWHIERRIERDESGNVTNYMVDFFDMGTSLPGETSEDDDFLYGGTGDDWLFGQNGQDHLDGGTGNDVLFGGRDNDLLVGGDGDDVLVGDDGINPSGQDGDDLLIGGAGNDVLGGDGGNDILYGGDDNDVLSGDNNKIDSALHGDDYLDGGSGHDSLYGQGGDDILIGGEGDDLLMGDQVETILPNVCHGNDILDGGTGNDTLLGMGGNDWLTGGDGNDWLAGDDHLSSDHVSSLVGDDSLSGGAGNDSLLGGGGHDYLDGGADDDLLFGGDGNDILYGGDGSDQLNGGAGDDFLDGGSGNDILMGGEGNDTLRGGAGLNVLQGGAGDDTYLLSLDDMRFVDGMIGSIEDADGFSYLKLLDVTQDRVEVRDGGNGRDIVLWVDGQPAVMLKEALVGTQLQIEFSDGRVVEFSRLLGEFYEEEIDAQSGVPDVHLYGGAGDDRLLALDSAGGAVLSGGRGNDDVSLLALGGGTVRFSIGDGVDYLTTQIELGKTRTGENLLRLGAGIALADLCLQKVAGDHFRLLIGHDSDAIAFRLPGSVASGETRPFDRVLFDDGQEASWQEVVANGVWVAPSTAGELFGTDADDWLQAGAGNERLDGGLGNDTYVFERGFGRDQVSNQGALVSERNRISFGENLGYQDARFVRRADDLFVFFEASGDRLQITGFFTNTGLETLEFSDGQVFDRDNPPAYSQYQQDLATSSDDVVDLTDGDDLFDALAGNDIVEAGAGNDTVYGGDGDDVLYGGDGNDLIYGGEGRDTLFGGNGDDRIHAYRAQIDAGSGDDFIEAPWSTIAFGQGNDTLWLARDSREIIVTDALPRADETKTLRFKADVLPDTVRVRRIDGELVLSWNNGSATLKLQGVYGIGAEMPELGYRVLFDGAPTVMWSAWDLLKMAMTGGQGNDTIYGSDLADVLNGLAGNDMLYGGGGDDILHGGAGNDKLYGQDGDDVLDGGTGNNELHGGEGRDTYRVFSTPGVETTSVTTIVAGEGPGDTVTVGGGLGPQDIRVIREGQSDTLRLVYFHEGRTTSTIVVLKDQLAAAGGIAPISQVLFEAYPDVIWSAAALRSLATRGGTGNDVLYGLEDSVNELLGGEGNDTLYGGALDDLLDGGAGEDVLAGGVGDDTYVFGHGYGSDTLIDASGSNKILLRAGVLPDDVKLVRTGQNGKGQMLELDSLVLVLSSSGEQLWIERFFQADGSTVGVDSIEFSDGTIWRSAELVALAGASISGTVDTLTGTIADDVFEVDHVDDTIVETADGGFDRVKSSVNYKLPDYVESIELTGIVGIDAVGNDGDNILIGNAGNNVLNGLEGNDSYYGGEGDDTYILQTKFVHADMPVYWSRNILVAEKHGEGVDTVKTNFFQYTLPENVENLTVVSANFAETVWVRSSKTPFFTYYGNELDNIIDLSKRTTDSGHRNFNYITLLDGGAGADTLIGSEHNDRYIVDNLNDVVIERYAHSSSDTVESSVTWSLGENIENLELTGREAIDGYGNGLGNTIDGSTNVASNVLAGEDGDDIYIIDLNDQVIERSGGGYDTLIVNKRSGNEARQFNLSAWNNIEVFKFAENFGSIDVVGDDRDNVIFTNRSIESIFGGAGDDTIHVGTSYRALVDGGKGDDTIWVALRQNAKVQLSFGPGSGNDILASIDSKLESEWRAGAWFNQSKLILDATTDGRSLRLNRDAADIVVRLDDNSEDSLRIRSFFGGSVSAAINSSLDAIQVGAETMLLRPALALAVGRDNFSVATEQDDLLISSVNGSVIDGGGGNDYLAGQDADDTLIGGEGNDYLIGGAGSDTFIFGLGWGHDTLDNEAYGWKASSAQDLIVFDSSVSANDLRFDRNDEGLMIIHQGTLDSILVRYTSADSGSVPGIRFADGTEITGEELLWRASSQTGSDGNDVMTLDPRYDRLLGLGGDDRLYGDGILDGGDGNDILEGSGLLIGGDGNDHLAATVGSSLEGGAGDDVLIAFDDVWEPQANTLEGGTGNDTVYGSFGADTYIFNLGDGRDLLIERRPEQAYSNVPASFDVLLFGVGIEAADLSFSRQGDDMLIAHANGQDQIIVQNWYRGGTDHFKLNHFLFADGSELTQAEAESRVEYHGTEGDDSISGTASNDVIHAKAGNDFVWAGSGDDVVVAGGGNDYIDGQAGNDSLSGGDGSDQLIGGTGDDLLAGEAGDDKYVYRPGDGMDTIVNSGGGTDGIFFTGGIAESSLSFSRVGDDLMIAVDRDVEQSVTVKGHFLGGDKAISYVQPDGGTSLSAARIAQIIAASEVPNTFNVLWTGTSNDEELVGGNGPDLFRALEGNDTLLGLGGHDLLHGGNGNDYLSGGDGSQNGSGNDMLFGGNGDDILDGEDGNDYLSGGTGDDAYYYRANGGVDVIDNSGGGFDGVVFIDIELSRLSFHRQSDDLIILVDSDLGQQIRITGHFRDNGSAIDYVQSDDGYLTSEQLSTVLSTIPGSEDPEDPVDPEEPVDPEVPPVAGVGGDDVVTGTASNDVLLGGAGNDTLNGLSGNDLLIGGLGDDRYVYVGGQDTLIEGGGSDTLVFSNGITFSQIASGLMKSGNDLILRVGGSTINQVTLRDFFLGGGNLIETILFETGGQLTADQIYGAFGMAVPNPTQLFERTIEGSVGDDLALDGTDGSDLLQGFNGNDALSGKGGADRLEGGNGSDTLNGGAGNDLLVGGRGDDTYVFAAGGGQDIIDNTGGGLDVLRFEGISFNQVATGLMKSANDLVLNVSGGSDKVTIKNWFLGGDYVLDRFAFASGGELSSSQIFAAFGMVNPDPTGSPAYQGVPDERAFGTLLGSQSGSQNIIGSSDADLIDGGSGNDSIRGAFGDDYLIGGDGNDKYFFSLGDGKDVINNLSNNASANKDIVVLEGVTKENLWLSRRGNDLVIDVTGSDDSITIQDWYRDSAQQVDTFVAGSAALYANAVDNLVNAMAAFGAPAGGELILSQTQRDELNVVIAANWQ